jgi:signal recognition particle subunit SEC65
MNELDRKDKQLEEPPIIRIAKALDDLGYEIRSYKPAINPIDMKSGELMALEIALKQGR